jgi:hypothetical protein
VPRPAAETARPVEAYLAYRDGLREGCAGCPREVGHGASVHGQDRRGRTRRSACGHGRRQCAGGGGARDDRGLRLRPRRPDRLRGRHHHLVEQGLRGPHRHGRWRLVRYGRHRVGRREERDLRDGRDLHLPLLDPPDDDGSGGGPGGEWRRWRSRDHAADGHGPATRTRRPGAADRPVHRPAGRGRLRRSLAGRRLRMGSHPPGPSVTGSRSPSRRARCPACRSRRR